MQDPGDWGDCRNYLQSLGGGREGKGRRAETEARPNADGERRRRRFSGEVWREKTQMNTGKNQADITKNKRQGGGIPKDEGKEPSGKKSPANV